MAITSIETRDARGNLKKLKSLEDGSGRHSVYHQAQIRNAVDDAFIDPAAGAQLPAALTAGGNLKTAIQEALPIGSNNIGDVDVLTLPALAAGGNHVGQVGGAVASVSVAPTVDTAPYADGDLIGGKLTFASALRVAAGSGKLVSAVLADKAKQSAAIDLILFDADPTGTTFTDQSPLTLADADLAKVIARVAIAGTDYTGFVDSSVAVKTAVDQALKVASGTSLYGCLISRGTPTYAAASDLTVKLLIDQD